MNWQPIETAPKDGTHIMVWDASFTDDFGSEPQNVVVCWCKDRWELSHYDAFSCSPANVTHWMPLPEPPQV